MSKKEFRKLRSQVWEFPKSPYLRSLKLDEPTIIDEEENKMEKDKSKKIFRELEKQTKRKYIDTIPKDIKKGSIIDYPFKTLDTQIWDLSGEKPKIREDIKEEILDKLYNGLMKNGFTHIDEIFKEIHITGSMGTYQYLPQTDVDVHIIPNIENIKKYYGDSGFDDIQHYLTHNLSGKEFENNKHILNYYLQASEAQELLGDAMYILNTDTWIVEAPKLPQFDPEQKFKPVWEKAKDWMDSFITGIGELRRDIKDVENLQTLLAGLSSEEKEWLENKLNGKYREVSQDLDKLAEEFTELHEARKRSYTEEVEPVQAFEDFQLSKSWGEQNIIWKFLERYGYVMVLANLRYIRDEKLTSEEKAEKVKKLFEDFNLMFERSEKKESIFREV